MEGSETVYNVSVPAADSAYQLTNLVVTAKRDEIVYLDFVQADPRVEGRAAHIARLALPAATASDLLNQLSELLRPAS